MPLISAFVNSIGSTFNLILLIYCSFKHSVKQFLFVCYVFPLILYSMTGNKVCPFSVVMFYDLCIILSNFFHLYYMDNNSSISLFVDWIYEEWHRGQKDWTAEVIKVFQIRAKWSATDMYITICLITDLTSITVLMFSK